MASVTTDLQPGLPCAKSPGSLWLFSQICLRQMASFTERVVRVRYRTKPSAAGGLVHDLIMCKNALIGRETCERACSDALLGRETIEPRFFALST